jgi:hypothetical protein
MGNDILSSDMLVGGLVRSIYNCYQFKDYAEGDLMLYDLNGFLKGFGTGIEDLPQPEVFTFSARDRLNPEEQYGTYRKMYAHYVMKALGMYNREMIDAIKNQQYPIPRMK